MKIGMLTGLWWIAERATVQESLHRIAALGFRYVDLHGVFHAGPIHLTDPERHAIRPELDSLGLIPRNYILHSPHNPASASDRDLEQDLAYLREGIDMAVEWGIRQLMLNPGQWTQGIPHRQAWDRATGFVQQVCDVAAERDVLIALEPEPYVWFLVNDLASASRMIADVNRPNIGLLADLGHMGLSRESRDDLEPLADRIMHAHFSEHEASRHTNQILGTGSTPTRELVDALRELDLDARVRRWSIDELVISCELGCPGDTIEDPDDWARKSLDHIKSLAPDLCPS